MAESALNDFAEITLIPESAFVRDDLDRIIAPLQPAQSLLYPIIEQIFRGRNPLGGSQETG